jgi:hypothetical protein
MAFIAIMAGKRRAVLLQHDDVFDEEGWRMVVKIWKVPKSQTSPEGIDYSLFLRKENGWWDTIITGRKDTIVMYWDEKARTPIAELTV